MKPSGLNNGEPVVIVLDVSCRDQGLRGKNGGTEKREKLIETELVAEKQRRFLMEACSLKEASARCTF